MKIKGETKDCRLIVKVKLSFGEKYNDNDLNFFASKMLRGFLKPKAIRRNLIEYSGPIGISLLERLRKPINKHDFLFIVEQIILTLQKVQTNGLLLNRVILDLNNIYVNEITKEVHFIYLPMVQNSQRVDLIEFIKTIVYSVNPLGDDSEYLSRFIYYLNSLMLFDVDKIEKFIMKEDKTVVATIKKQNLTQSGYMTNKPLHHHEHYSQKKEQNEINANIVGDEQPTTILVDDEATTLLVDEEATTLLNQDEEETTLLVEDNEQIVYPTLFRVSTEETISVNKPVFRLGKERSYVDYFVTNNNAVSRSHADIITRGENYYVTDLNSKNRTYINGKILQAHIENEIREGDILKLGNEEFIFHI